MCSLFSAALPLFSFVLKVLFTPIDEMTRLNVLHISGYLWRFFTSCSFIIYTDTCIALLPASGLLTPSCSLFPAIIYRVPTTVGSTTSVHPYSFQLIHRLSCSLYIVKNILYIVIAKGPCTLPGFHHPFISAAYAPQIYR